MFGKLFANKIKKRRIDKFKKKGNKILNEKGFSGSRKYNLLINYARTKGMKLTNYDENVKNFMMSHYLNVIKPKILENKKQVDLMLNEAKIDKLVNDFKKKNVISRNEEIETRLINLRN